MLMLSLNKTVDCLAMANSVHLYGHLLRREDGHVLRKALSFRLKVKGRKAGWGGHGRSRLRKQA